MQRAKGIAVIILCFFVIACALAFSARFAHAQSLIADARGDMYVMTEPSEKAETAVELSMYVNTTLTRWRLNGNNQIPWLLRSPVESIRVGTMQNVIFRATYVRDAYDWSPTVPVLLDAYQNDPHDGIRMLALAGLHAIGDTDALKTVRALYSDEAFRAGLSLQLRRQTHHVLVDYLGLNKKESED